MRRLLVIPVAGTIAAAVVVLLAHEPREEEPGPVFPEPPPPPVLPDDDAEPPAPPPEEEKAEPAEPENPPEPPPPVAEYYLQLQQDGNLVELNSSRRFTDTAAVIQGLGNDETRHRIFLSNGEGVEEAALDKLLEGLSAKFEVRKVYRAPEKEEE